MAETLKMATIYVANGFYQTSYSQGVCVPILVLVSRNERLLLLPAPLHAEVSTSLHAH